MSCWGWRKALGKGFQVGRRARLSVADARYPRLRMRAVTDDSWPFSGSYVKWGVELIFAWADAFPICRQGTGISQRGRHHIADAPGSPRPPGRRWCIGEWTHRQPEVTSDPPVSPILLNLVHRRISVSFLPSSRTDRWSPFCPRMPSCGWSGDAQKSSTPRASFR